MLGQGLRVSFVEFTSSVKTGWDSKDLEITLRTHSVTFDPKEQDLGILFSTIIYVLNVRGHIL